MEIYFSSNTAVFVVLIITITALAFLKKRKGLHQNIFVCFCANRDASLLISVHDISVPDKGGAKIAMTRCGAYECTEPYSRDDDGKDAWCGMEEATLEKKKEFASYESISHIYAEIGKNAA